MVHEYLTGMLLEEGVDHEDLTAPLLVIVSVEKSTLANNNTSILYVVSQTLCNFKNSTILVYM